MGFPGGTWGGALKVRDAGLDGPVALSSRAFLTVLCSHPKEEKLRCNVLLFSSSCLVNVWVYALVRTLLGTGEPRSLFLRNPVHFVTWCFSRRCALPQSVLEDERVVRRVICQMWDLLLFPLDTLDILCWHHPLITPFRGLKGGRQFFSFQFLF